MSKVDVKIWQCVFLNYGLDEFRYRLYDLIDKKQVISQDVVFIENQIIQNIEKTNKTMFWCNDSSVNLNSVPLIDFSTRVEHAIQND